MVRAVGLEPTLLAEPDFESVKRSRARKLDTRRKILVGALAWAHWDHDGYFKKALMALLNDYILKDEERALSICLRYHRSN